MFRNPRLVFSQKFIGRRLVSTYRIGDHLLVNKYTFGWKPSTDQIENYKTIINSKPGTGPNALYNLYRAAGVLIPLRTSQSNQSGNGPSDGDSNSSVNNGSGDGTGRRRKAPKIIKDNQEDKFPSASGWSNVETGLYGLDRPAPWRTSTFPLVGQKSEEEIISSSNTAPSTIEVLRTLNKSAGKYLVQQEETGNLSINSSIGKGALAICLNKHIMANNNEVFGATATFNFLASLGFDDLNKGFAMIWQAPLKVQSKLSYTAKPECLVYFTAPGRNQSLVAMATENKQLDNHPGRRTSGTGQLFGELLAGASAQYEALGYRTMLNRPTNLVMCMVNFIGIYGSLVVGQFPLDYLDVALTNPENLVPKIPRPILLRWAPENLNQLGFNLYNPQEFKQFYIGLASIYLELLQNKQLTLESGLESNIQSGLLKRETWDLPKLKKPF